MFRSSQCCARRDGRSRNARRSNARPDAKCPAHTARDAITMPRVSPARARSRASGVATFRPSSGLGLASARRREHASGAARWRRTGAQDVPRARANSLARQRWCGAGPARLVRTLPRHGPRTSRRQRGADAMRSGRLRRMRVRAGARGSGERPDPADAAHRSLLVVFTLAAALARWRVAATTARGRDVPPPCARRVHHHPEQLPEGDQQHRDGCEKRPHRCSHAIARSTRSVRADARSIFLPRRRTYTPTG
jgi:hypothetical protein